MLAQDTPPRKPKEAPVVAYSYQRFSTPEQAKGDSLRRQTELRDAWVKKMGVTLDTKLTLRDAGKSGFRGRHRENPDRNALAAFLQLVERGDIPRGSYLIVESLDRLTREHVQPALLLFLNLLQAGVRIVQLIPVEQVFHDKSEAMQIMMAVMELVRGHGESAVKSQRLSAVWGEKKKRAAKGEVISRACPAWMEVRGGKYELVSWKADVVRRIFKLATGGLGARAIVAKLIAERVKPISNRARAGWNASYVRVILTTRAAFGEYTPMTGEGKNRKPDGKPIPNFYPAVVTEDEWHAAQGAKTLKKAGRPSRQGVNVFAGLALDALTGSPMHMHTFRHGERSYKAILSYRGQQAGGNVSFPLSILEQAVLGELEELDPREILADDKSADEVLVLSGQRAELDTRRERIKMDLVGVEEEEYASLRDVLRLVDTELKKVDADLRVARQRAASPLAEAWGEVQTLARAIGAGKVKDAKQAAERARLRLLDTDETRIKLRAALRQIVSGMWCVFVGKRKGKLAAVRVQFAGSDQHRDYLVVYKPEVVGFGGRHPAQWVSTSEVWPPETGAFDLRDPDDAKKAETFLGTVDGPALAAAIEAKNAERTAGTRSRTSAPKRKRK